MNQDKTSVEDQADKSAAYFAQQVKYMQNNLPGMKDLAKATAELVHFRYHELTKNGFTEEQAMRLLIAGIV